MILVVLIVDSDSNYGSAIIYTKELKKMMISGQQAMPSMYRQFKHATCSKANLFFSLYVDSLPNLCSTYFPGAQPVMWSIKKYVLLPSIHPAEK